ncbi:MAG: hypothetical protein OXG88_08320 [Gammaproteobacteria bacterium]|nr:hypothetical protein [Gammaproteobacteria bacterium]
MKRASTSEAARRYRQDGHDDATIFALLIGLDSEYLRDAKAKKDVVDLSGDTHSVKSGAKKWQIFLYRRSRFLNDDGFQALNGIGSLLVHCIDAFPPRYSDYEDNKDAAKERLQAPMRELRDRFQRKALLRAFLRKSIFNGGEVNYLTVCHDDAYHIYWSDDVVNIMANGFEVVNSKARRQGEFDDQKVLFRYKERNVGELEMRNESAAHYGEVRFNMNKKPCLQLLRDAELVSNEFTDIITTYGRACQTFGNWPPKRNN